MPARSNPSTATWSDPPSPQPRANAFERSSEFRAVETSERRKKARSPNTHREALSCTNVSVVTRVQVRQTSVRDVQSVEAAVDCLASLVERLLKIREMICLPVMVGYGPMRVV